MPALESLFIKKRLQNRCFPVNIAKFLRTAFYGTPAIEQLRLLLNSSLISNVNLKKSKKKLCLHFDNSHANQTNTTNIDMIFFHTMLTPTKI